MNKIISTVVMVAITVILLGSLLVPIIDDANENIVNEKTNDQGMDLIRMSYGTPSDNLKVEKPANEAVLNMYLGESETPYYTVPLNTNGQTAWALVTSSFSYGITGGAGSSLFDYTARYNNNGSSNHYGLEKDFTVTVDVTTGAIRVITGGNTYSWYDNCDVTSIYWADPNGDYVNVNVSNVYPPIYIENPKEIIGSVMIGGNYVFWESTDDPQVTNSKPATFTPETTESNGLYRLDKLSYTITGTNDSVNTGSMSHVIVKYQVLAEVVPDGNNMVPLLYVIPVIIIVSLVVAVAGIFISRDR